MKRFFLWPALIASLSLTVGGRAFAQPYTFGAQTQSTNTASLTYNSAKNTFQYSDATNSSYDSARLPLAGAAAALITTTNDWTASHTATIAARTMTATFAESPHVWMELDIVYRNGSSTYLLTFGLHQENNSGGANDENFPDGFFGTTADFRARTNGNDDVTTPLGASQFIQGGSVLVLSGATIASPATESIGAVTAEMALRYSAASNTVTGYCNGTPVGSYSLGSWGNTPPLTLFVAGTSGAGVGVPLGTATTSNFYAGTWPSLATTHSGGSFVLAWPTNAAGFRLQSTTNLSASASWTTNFPAPVVVKGQNVVTNPISSRQKFFRLGR